MRRGRILSMALAGAVVLGACSGGPDREQPQDRPSSSTAASGATGPSGGDRSSLSGRIVFDNFDDVWSINADGTDLTRLTRSPEPEFDPTWSPDGTQIAFRFERNGDSEIWLMNADGSQRRRLTRGLSPAWSPDGSKIVYASPGEIPCPPGRGLRCTGLSIMNADGSGQHRLSHTDGGEYPSWSPTGSESPSTRISPATT
jgi:Tol biopolymer transport system component